MKGNKLLSSSPFRQFSGMESDIRLTKVFIVYTKSFVIIPRTKFCKYEGDGLTGIEALLDSIAKQVEDEGRL